MFSEEVFVEDNLSVMISEGRLNTLNNNSQHEHECSQEVQTGNRLLHRKSEDIDLRDPVRKKKNMAAAVCVFWRWFLKGKKPCNCNINSKSEMRQMSVSSFLEMKLVIYRAPQWEGRWTGTRVTSCSEALCNFGVRTGCVLYRPPARTESAAHNRRFVSL